MTTVTQVYGGSAGGSTVTTTAATVLSLSPGSGTFGVSDGIVDGGMWDGFDLFDPDGQFTNIVEDGAESVVNTGVASGYFRPAYENGTRFDNYGFALTRDSTGDWTVELKMKYETTSASTTHLFAGPGACRPRGDDSAFLLTTANDNSTKVRGRSVVGTEQVGETDGATSVDPTSFWYYKCERLGADIIYSESADGVTWTTVRTAEDDVVGAVAKAGLIAGNWTQYAGIITIESGTLTYFPAE